MLTADLVQARVYRGEIRPRYLDAEDEDNLALAAQLIDIFQAHVGAPRQDLDHELKELLGTGTAFVLHRGLAKLLLDRSSFDTEAAMEPEALRQKVFEAAAAAYRRDLDHPPDADAEAQTPRFDRAAVLATTAAELELEVEAVERSLYADLRDEQILQEWQPCTPSWLLQRYNVALAQGVLLRASKLEIRLGGGSPERHRALFGKIKFFQLMHRVERDGSGYLIHLDGPLSLFKSSQKYGLQMATFLPTLLHFDSWHLSAEVLWGKKRRRLQFSLSPADHLHPHTKLTGQWRPEELSWLPEQLAKLNDDWRVCEETELIDLGGQGVLVPDFVFEHRPSGMRAYMEVLGFWRKGVVASRLRLLERYGPPNLILALSKQLAGDQEGLDALPGEVYVFRSTPIARQVLAILERLLPAAPP